MRKSREFRWLVVVLLWTAAATASASFHEWRINEIYSNADGTIQFIEFREIAGANGENFLIDHTLVSSGHTLTFETNLPSVITAHKMFIVGTQGFADLGIVAPDYVIPNGFLSVSGGTLQYGAMPSDPYGGGPVDVVSYPALPTDGTTSIDRTGVPQTNSPTNFAGTTATIAAIAATPDLNQHGLTGSWYEPATSGQGVEIEVFPNATSGIGSAFVSWFTYDSAIGGAERQRWYTAEGQTVTGQPTAALTIFQNTGGNFNAPPITNAQAVGTATLSFNSCADGQLSYTFTDGTGRSGTIPLTRLTQNVTCSVTTPHPINVDFALSGNWFDPATSGQGLTVEVNPNSSAVFLAWYTYMPNGAGAAAAGQRWYTAEGTFTPGMRSIPVTIFETTGGMFDAPTPAGERTVAVGNGTLAFQSCLAVTFSYNFTGGSSTGMSGLIALSRVGPAPPGCA